MEIKPLHNQKTALSVVIPVYNSAEIFPELYRRLCNVLKDDVDSFEIIAVLDGCTDNSYEVIYKSSLQDKRVKIIEFSRNFGHQSSVAAGLEHAEGEMVVIMDDDLEDPPEILPKFISKFKEDFDVVYGIRRRRKTSFLHRTAYFLFYRILGKLADIKIPYDSGDFCIMRRNVVDALNNMPEKNRFIRGLRAWSGFRQTGIEYDRGGRLAGASGYSLRKYLRLAMDGIVSFSYRPLNYISISGIVIAFVGFFVGMGLIALKLMGGIKDVPGWTSLAFLLLFFSGVQLISLGIIGAYISRIYDEVKHRPKYIIRRTAGLERKRGN